MVVEPILVAVYGTLKRGHYNHGWIKVHGSKFIGTGVTERLYTMYNLGRFPAITKKETNRINCEVFQVSSKTLENLDFLEGHPNSYVRELVPILMDSAETVNAWLYIFPEDIKNFEEITSWA